LEVNTLVQLQGFVQDFTTGLIAADLRRPQAVDTRSGTLFKPGIGPHSEADAISLIANELELAVPSVYAGRISLGVPYPDAPGQKCDLCIGSQPNWAWAVEVMMLRYLGDDGKLSDNILMQHRRAVTDCVKLAKSPLGERKALLIYGFDHVQWPLDPAIDGFETLAGAKVGLGSRHVVAFDRLMHPIHARGRVFAWGIQEMA
jgi:hypothetical protein